MNLQPKRLLRIASLSLIALGGLLTLLFVINLPPASATHRSWMVAEGWCTPTDGGSLYNDEIYIPYSCGGDAADSMALEFNYNDPYCAVIINFKWVSGSNWTRASIPTFIDCPPAGSEAEAPTPPSTWLAWVCEPNDGFSDPEYGNVITIGSDASSKPFGTTLYYGASIDGPWTATTFGAPNYILTKTQVEALAADAGVGLNGLWFKVSDAGILANLGSMITDRAAHMDGICNPGD